MAKNLVSTDSTTPPYKVLCIFSRILGGKTFSAELEKMLRSFPNLQLTIVNFEGRDYTDFPVPFWYKVSDAAETVSIIRKKLRKMNLSPSDFDILFFQSYQLTASLKHQITFMPTIIALDATPKAARRGNAKAGRLKATIRSLLGEALDVLWYQKIFDSTSFFLARTGIVKASLEQDYSIDPDIVEVTYLPTEIIKQRNRGNPERVRILFVGNDFERKGGNFILDAYKELPADKCELVIVSTDITLKERAWPETVTFIGGLTRSAVLELYSNCDIYVLPTFKDELGLAICEAMAAGLPIVARDATAQHEIVIDEITGFLMPYNSSTSEWARQLMRLIDDPQLRKELGYNAQQFASGQFGYEAFRQKLKRALQATGAVDI